MASWSTPAHHSSRAKGNKSAFMQPSGGGPDHKAFWLKKKNSCPRNVVQLRCHGAPRFVHSSQLATVVFLSVHCGFQRPISSCVDMAGCNRSDCARHSSVSSPITTQPFSGSTPPFIPISINQSTTFQLYSSPFIFSNFVHNYVGLEQPATGRNPDVPLFAGILW